MTVWIDAQLSPLLAPWLSEYFSITATPLRDLGLRDAGDLAIFHAARDSNAIVMTKDSDFIGLLERFGPPPKVIWITCGNTSNARMKDILLQTLPNALALLRTSEALVEINSIQ